MPPFPETNSSNVQLLVNTLPNALRDVIEMILFDFGVIYSWVSISLNSPGAWIGAGVGGYIGGAVAGLAGLAGLGAGIVLGGLIGSGIYDLMVPNQRGQEMERFRRYWAAAGGAGAYGQPTTILGLFFLSQTTCYYRETQVLSNSTLFSSVFTRKLNTNVAAGLVYECRSGNSGGMYYFHGDADGGLEVSVVTQGQ